MKTLTQKLRFSLQQTALAFFGFAAGADGSTALTFPPSGIGYINDLDELTRGLALQVQVERKTITASRAIIKERVHGSINEPTIDPIEMNVPLDAERRRNLIERLARKGREREVAMYFDSKRASPAAAANAQPTVSKVRIDPSALDLFNLDEVAKIFGSSHHSLKVATAPLRRRNGMLGKALLRQMAPFFSAQELDSVREAMGRRATLDVDRMLLPFFGRKTVGLYTKYRGPNCFQAALAFQDPALPWNPAVNSKLEAGYHRAMINHDELWWALNQYFVEIDPTQQSMRYGDVLVFLDAPLAERSKPVNFRWIKHAAAYLFGEFVFSKGSNSPTSPYTVKTLQEEWDTWAGRTSQLSMKVFRRLPQLQQDLANSASVRSDANSATR